MEQRSKTQSMCIRIGCAQATKPSVHSWLWSIGVLVTFIAQVIMNVLAGEEFGSFGGGSNSEISAEQPTFVTPDGLTFSVWGIIYLFQAIFCIYQVTPCFQNSHAGVSRARPWVVLLFIANCLWLPVFSNRLFFLAFLIMLVMDLALIMIYRMMAINYGAADQTQPADALLPSLVVESSSDTRARLGIDDSTDLPVAQLHPWTVKVLCFVGFSTNISWLAVASMVNLLVATGNSGWRQPFVQTNLTNVVTETLYVDGSVDFAVMAVCLVAVLASVLVVRNCDLPYALVAMWALWGVYRAQAVKASTGFPENAMSPKIADWCLAMIVVVAIAAVVGLVKAIVETICARKHSAHKPENESIQKDQKKSLYTDEVAN